MEEVWKDIKGYEGLYQVSSLGRIKSLDRYIERKDGTVYFWKGKIMSPAISNTGYLVTSIYKNKKKKQVQIHRLVAEAFIPNPNNRPEVNHINGKRNDARIDNLEWVNRSENQLHAFRVLGRGYVLPTKEQMQKKVDKKGKKIIQYEIKVIISEKARYKSIREAERQTGVVRTSISRCCKHIQEKAGKYIFRFEDDEIKDKD